MFKRDSKFWYAYLIISVFLIGKYLHDRKIDEYRSSIKMKAVVIDRIETSGRISVNYDYPQYSYNYNDSNYINADRNAHSKRRSPGDSVTIIFKKEKPDDAIIYNFFRYWIPLPYLIIGVLMALFFYFAAINFADYIDFKNNPDKYD